MEEQGERGDHHHDAREEEGDVDIGKERASRHLHVNYMTHNMDEI